MEAMKKMLGNKWTTLAGVIVGIVGVLLQSGIVPMEYIPLANKIITVAGALGLVAAKDGSTGSAPA